VAVRRLLERASGAIEIGELVLGDLPRRIAYVCSTSGGIDCASR